jgi:hypothetical protein
VRQILFVFVDGVGLGESDHMVNPLLNARLPTLHRLLGGAPIVAATAPLHTPTTSLVGLDAALGVEGLPQSGTGQAALLTGRNAPRLFGRHYGPWVPTTLRPIVAEESFLARLVDRGHDVAFANAYPEEALEPPAPGRRDRSPLRAGPPLAARAAGLLTRHTTALELGDAVTSEITNEAWRERLNRTSLPVITPEQAGRNLARIAARHHLTLYAYYETDTAGHRGSMKAAVTVLERLDAFLAGVLKALPPEVLVVLASDHGNIEDIRCGHTRNPALALATGPGHREFVRGVRALTGVAGRVGDLENRA